MENYTVNYRWLETHFEISVYLNNGFRNIPILEEIKDKEGFTSLYDLALDWTNEFEEAWKTEQNEDFWDSIEAWLKTRTEKLWMDEFENLLSIYYGLQLNDVKVSADILASPLGELDRYADKYDLTLIER